MWPDLKIRLGTIVLLVLLYFSTINGFLDRSLSTRNKLQSDDTIRQDFKITPRTTQQPPQVSRIIFNEEKTSVFRESSESSRKLHDRGDLDRNNNVVRRQRMSPNRIVKAVDEIVSKRNVDSLTTANLGRIVVDQRSTRTLRSYSKNTRLNTNYGEETSNEQRYGNMEMASRNRYMRQNMERSRQETRDGRVTLFIISDYRSSENNNRYNGRSVRYRKSMGIERSIRKNIDVVNVTFLEERMLKPTIYRERSVDRTKVINAVNRRVTKSSADFTTSFETARTVDAVSIQRRTRDINRIGHDIKNIRGIIPTSVQQKKELKATRERTIDRDADRIDITRTQQSIPEPRKYSNRLTETSGRENDASRIEQQISSRRTQTFSTERRLPSKRTDVISIERRMSQFTTVATLNSDTISIERRASNRKIADISIERRTSSRRSDAIFSGRSLPEYTEAPSRKGDFISIERKISNRRIDGVSVERQISSRRTDIVERRMSEATELSSRSDILSIARRRTDANSDDRRTSSDRRMSSRKTDTTSTEQQITRGRTAAASPKQQRRSRRTDAISIQRRMSESTEALRRRSDTISTEREIFDRRSDTTSMEREMYGRRTDAVSINRQTLDLTEASSRRNHVIFNEQRMSGRRTDTTPIERRILSRRTETNSMGRLTPKSNDSPSRRSKVISNERRIFSRRTDVIFSPLQMSGTTEALSRSDAIFNERRIFSKGTDAISIERRIANRRTDATSIERRMSESTQTPTRKSYVTSNERQIPTTRTDATFSNQQTLSRRTNGVFIERRTTRSTEPLSRSDSTSNERRISSRRSDTTSTEQRISSSTDATSIGRLVPDSTVAPNRRSVISNQRRMFSSRCTDATFIAPQTSSRSTDAIFIKQRLSVFTEALSKGDTISNERRISSRRTDAFSFARRMLGSTEASGRTTIERQLSSMRTNKIITKQEMTKTKRTYERIHNRNIGDSIASIPRKLSETRRNYERSHDRNIEQSGTIPGRRTLESKKHSIISINRLASSIRDRDFNSLQQITLTARANRERLNIRNVHLNLLQPTRSGLNREGLLHVAQSERNNGRRRISTTHEDSTLIIRFSSKNSNYDSSRDHRRQVYFRSNANTSRKQVRQHTKLDGTLIDRTRFEQRARLPNTEIPEKQNYRTQSYFSISVLSENVQTGTPAKTSADRTVFRRQINYKQDHRQDSRRNSIYRLSTERITTNTRKEIREQRANIFSKDLTTTRNISKQNGPLQPKEFENKISRDLSDNNPKILFNRSKNFGDSIDWLSIAKGLLISITISQILSNSNPKRFRFVNLLARYKEKVY